MKRFILFLSPILLGFIAFVVFVIILSKVDAGVGALQITAIPQSTVYLNGKSIGKTPLCKCEGKERIKAGEYTVKLVPLSGQNIFPYEEHITITKGILTVVDRTFGAGSLSSGSVITLVPIDDKKAVQLSVSSFPTGASVAIDGNDSGKTPLFVKTLTDSDHDLVVSKEGYKDKTIHVHTVAGYQLDALITLGIAPLDATAAAAFQNAALTPVAKTKITILDTPTGFLRVRLEPSLNASETAQVKPGDTFDYVSEQDGWYEIQLPNSTTGWVSTQYAKKQ